MSALFSVKFNRRFSISFAAALSAAIVVLLLAELATAQVSDRYPIMHMTAAERQAASERSSRLPRPMRALAALPADQRNLLPLLPHVAAERNQMHCGNCWVWAANGAAEVALNVQTGIRERLSIQYLNSNFADGGTTGSFACDGGWPDTFTNFYENDGNKVFVPWANTNAAWADGDGGASGGYGGGKRTNMAGYRISTSPAFPISSIRALLVDTYGIEQEQAINNIKTLLNENKAVVFSFFLPDSASWNAFYTFWDSQDDTALFNTDPYDMLAWNDAQAGGHSVLIVGYNDTDPNPANHYWELVNSWGVTPTRPNGTFRIPMHINYSNKDSTYFGQNLWLHVVDPVFDLDSDNDGITDAQEIVDGSDPEDKGSALSVRPTTLCSEWNGFLEPMWNIMEHNNLSAQSVAVTSTLYDQTGAASDTVGFSVPANAQSDLLVHGMTARTTNSYGKICSVYEGTAGDMDGRMVYYRPNTDDPTSFDFAFAMPFSSGLTGIQYVGYNTYQPSFDPADSENFVANWIQLTNLTGLPQSGTLTVYNQTGEVVGVQSVELKEGERADFSGHQFGSALVGLVKWEPTDLTASFQLRNVRYYYDRTGSHITSAYQTAGAYGSGRPLTAPLNTIGETSVIELANGSAATISASVSIYNSTGTTSFSSTLSLAPYTTYHIVADEYLQSDIGVAVVQSNNPETLLANIMQYKRTGTGGLKYVYPIPATEALGTTLHGAYNTHLGQQNWLIVTNSSDSAKLAALSIANETGTLIAQQGISVPAHQSRFISLSSYVLPSSYGMLRLNVDSNSLVATLLRAGANESYCLSTPLRQ